MSLRASLFGAALTLVTAGQGLAQEVVGSTVLGGKKVHLLSDNTWKFAESETSSRCVSVHVNIEFCGSFSNWRPTAKTGDFSVMFHHSGNIYAGLIIEEFGWDEGSSFEFMRSAALEHAAFVSQVPIEQIPVLDVYDVKIDGHHGETMVYGAVIDGLNVVYANTLLITQDLTVQSLVWNVGKEFDAEFQTWNADFLDNLKLAIDEDVQ
ncbi:MAG: hypothetical protein JXR13_05225 [Thalassovita sp.]